MGGYAEKDKGDIRMKHYFTNFFDGYHFGICGKAQKNGYDKHSDYTKIKKEVTCAECLKRIKWQEKVIPVSKNIVGRRA